jgi:phospholipase C
MLRIRALGCLTAAFIMASAAARADGDRNFTTTPIKHLVVIFQENESFDHYFGTYPHAQNNPGEPAFHALPDTPTSINTLETPLDVNNKFKPLKNVDLLNRNPNSLVGTGQTINGAFASNPFRLSPAQALTPDQNHADTAEQEAYDNGAMDAFPHDTGTAGTIAGASIGPQSAMGYFDGNTVTALWHYAQHFAMNDNMFTSQFGPSTPGALNLIAGQTNGMNVVVNGVNATGVLASSLVNDGSGNFTLINDSDPYGDVCSTKTGTTISMHGQNIGDLLNAHGTSWGWFEGGFDLTVTNPNGTTGCARSSTGVVGNTTADYIQHHQPFQYFASTANPTHARPASVEAIGHSRDPHTGKVDPANHQYDTRDFFAALDAGNLPDVSFIKAPAIEDAHPGYSDPLDEQRFIVHVLNSLQKSPEWKHTAVIITYDDSDGWYDHQMPPIVNTSFSSADMLNGKGVCNMGLEQDRTPGQLNGSFGLPAQGRCGYGTRIPLLLISPFAKKNFVDHTLIDQSSVTRFIEDNWLGGERIQAKGSFDTIAGPLLQMFNFETNDGDSDSPRVLLDPTTGEVTLITATK